MGMIGSMPEHVPTVLAIGSCRIFRPLRPLHEQGLINLVNYIDNQWFTHTAGAARQYVDVMRGAVHIPVGLRRSALETSLTFPEDMSHAAALSADVVIVEVSSVKQYMVDSIHLNAHKVYGVAVDSGAEYRDIMQGRTGELPDEHVLKPMKVTNATWEDIAADLIAIREIVGAPVMTVDALYAETDAGEPIPDRVRLTEALQRVEDEHGIPLCSTKPLIQEHGIDVALTDSTHYRLSFEPTAAHYMLEKVRSVLGATV